MTTKIGVVDVGGGFRGIYGAGVLDYCIHNGIWFNLGIGISTGSYNLASYSALQPLRNHKFYTEYELEHKYRERKNYHLTPSSLDFEYIYTMLTNYNRNYPLDYGTMMANPIEFLTAITEADTGISRYISKRDFFRDASCYTPFMVFSALPGVCRPVTINGVLYYDGALDDPVPVTKAFDLGCDKVILILTLPENTVLKTDKDAELAHRISKEFPNTAEALMNRAKRYNEGVERARQYAAEGKLLIIAPDDTCGVHSLSQDTIVMNHLYRKGYTDAEKIIPFMFD